MKRKLLATILAFALCLGLATPAFAAGPTGIVVEEITIAVPKMPGLEVTLTDVYDNVFAYQNGPLGVYFVEGGNSTFTFNIDAYAHLGNLGDGDDRFAAFKGGVTYTFTEQWNGSYNIIPESMYASGQTPDSMELFNSSCLQFFPLPLDSGFLPEGSLSIFDFAVSPGIDAPAGETPSDWAIAFVSAAIAAGLVPESLQMQYTQATTRAEFCALAVALYETVKGSEIAISRDVKFTDTNDTNVLKMATLEVVNGIGDGLFGPEQTLTREQAATMLYRLSEAVGKPLPGKAPTFEDGYLIADWAIVAVGHVEHSGIMNGVGGGLFAPHDDYTREQSITTILRLFDVLK